MCDYSLHGIRNRLADEGETLVVHRFYTGSKGLTSPEYLTRIETHNGFLGTLRKIFGAQPQECAVCIPDGAKLVVAGIPPALRQAHGLQAAEVATFRQLSAEPATYRDAVEFENGATIRLQQLDEGQKIQVAALSSVEVREDSPNRRTRHWEPEPDYWR
jgi:hypothetical protein